MAGFVALGVGVAGMATFAGAGVSSNNRYDSIYAACGGKRCTDPSFTAQIAGGKQLDVVADVGLGAGIAGLAAGALLVALGGPRPASDAPRVSVWAAPTCGAWSGGGGAGLGAPLLTGVRGSF